MKRVFLTIVFALVMFGVKAQDMASVFTAMPDQYIPQLENEWRKDLIDLYNAGKEAKLQNTMNGFSTLKKLTANYLLLQVTDQSTVEMKLLPLVNNTNVVCVVNTVNGPVPDSRIAFYTTEWKPLNPTDLFTPVSSEWFIKENTDKKSESFRLVLPYLDMDLVKYTLDPDSLTLTATYTTPLYLGKEERKMIAPFLKDSPKVYNWEKFHFK